MTVEDVLREFMSDIEDVGLDHTREEWPDLLVTYKHAREALGLPFEDIRTYEWEGEEGPAGTYCPMHGFIPEGSDCPC